jgi:hypothetical protein
MSEPQEGAWAWFIGSEGPAVCDDLKKLRVHTYLVVEIYLQNRTKTREAKKKKKKRRVNVQTRNIKDTLST